MREAPPLVLASASPRRTKLLTQLGLPHEVDPAHVPETEVAAETPEAHAERLARAKAEEIRGRHPGALVIAGDTVVVVDGRSLGKPTSDAEARRMLRTLAGRTHMVCSGLALAGPAAGVMRSRVDRARVTMREFDDDEARAYVATGEPLDKAGAYGIQGAGAALVRRVEGDYYTVVGLPVSGLLELLARAGWRCAFPGLVPCS